MSIAQATPPERPPILPVSDTESAFHALWSTLPADNPMRLATAGGALADRFAWVFMAGYQGAVRAVFPEFASAGWMCLAAAEAKGAEPARLDDGPAVSGTKSWIAGADHVARLVVAIGPRDERRFVACDRGAPGLALANPRKPGFLAELTQGAATFDGVPVVDGRVLEEPARGLLFRSAEPLFVLAAMNAMMAVQANLPMRPRTSIAEAAQEAITYAGTMVPQLDDRPAMKVALDRLARWTAETMAAFEGEMLEISPPALRRSWVVDARLPEMFGAGPAAAEGGPDG